MVGGGGERSRMLLTGVRVPADLDGRDRHRHESPLLAVNYKITGNVLNVVGGAAIPVEPRSRDRTRIRHPERWSDHDRSNRHPPRRTGRLVRRTNPRSLVRRAHRGPGRQGRDHRHRRAVGSRGITRRRRSRRRRRPLPDRRIPRGDAARADEDRRGRPTPLPADRVVGGALRGGRGDLHQCLGAGDDPAAIRRATDPRHPDRHRCGPKPFRGAGLVRHPGRLAPGGVDRPAP